MRRPEGWRKTRGGHCRGLGSGGWLLVGALVAAPTPSLTQPFQEREGYQLWSTRVVVESQRHWRDWDAPDGTRSVEADGTVQPRFLRRDLNAVLNAGEFTNVVEGDTLAGGIRAVGVRADTLDAPFILDGDPSTWWEPDTEQPDDAWVEIDLGRAVIANRVTLRFAREGEGDPFLKFRVLVSDGTEGFGSRRKREFIRVGQVAVPNKHQREFTFDIEPSQRIADGMTGQPVQFVRIDMLDTDGPRAAEVSEEVYTHLGPDDRGAIDYFRRTVAGREIRVIEESYDELSPEEQGSVRHYRREHPRLADVEIEALGDNIVTLTQRPLFSSGSFFDDLARRFVTDGLVRTGFTIRVYDPFRDRNQMRIDLGAMFWIDRLRMVSSHDPLTSYQLRVSDGSLDPNGEYAWHAFEEQVNVERFLQVEERFGSRQVRFIELRRLDLLGDVSISGRLNEIQAYGEGYVSEVVLTSPLIKLNGRQMVTDVAWEGTAPPGATVEVRTRSGDGITQVGHFHNRAGQEVSEAMYERLKPQDQGPVYVDEFPGPDWSRWSEPYPATGPFLSPSPRLMVMAQVALRSQEPLRHASIRRLVLTLAPPLVDRALAEITPTRNVPPGVDREFKLYVRPVLEPGDVGFDRLRVHSSSSAPLEIVSVRAGQDADLRFGSPEQLWPGEAEISSLADGGVEVGLPPGTALARVFEVTLRASVFLPSTSFSIELLQGSRRQSVDAGDASSLVASNSLAVAADLRNEALLGAVEVVPRVFTPNDDGINDETRLKVTVFQVQRRHRIVVSVHDLAGHRVRDLSLETEHPSGMHQMVWDGRDDSGHLMPPGTYLLRVHIPTHVPAQGTSVVRSVSLAY